MTRGEPVTRGERATSALGAGDPARRALEADAGGGG